MHESEEVREVSGTDGPSTVEYGDDNETVPDSSQSGKTNSPSVYMVDYSDRSFAVFGDTKPIKEELKGLGGRFNKYLKHDGVTMVGWIFPLKARADVEELIGKASVGRWDGDIDQCRNSYIDSIVSKGAHTVGNKSNIDNDGHASSVYMVDYSDRSFAVFGDTKPIKEELKELGGRFNKYLKHDGLTKVGWIFPLKARANVEELIGK